MWCNVLLNSDLFYRLYNISNDYGGNFLDIFYKDITCNVMVVTFFIVSYINYDNMSNHNRFNRKDHNNSNTNDHSIYFEDCMGIKKVWS